VQSTQIHLLLLPKNRISIIIPTKYKNMTNLILFTVLYVVLLGIINATETSVYSSQEIKLRANLESQQKLGKKTAQMVLAIKEKMPKFIGTVAICINTVTQVGPFALGYLASTILEPTGLSIYLVILTFAVIIFGEIFPKNFGEHHSYIVSGIFAPAVIVIMKILSPILYLIEKLVAVFFKNDKDAFNTSEEEIKMMVEMGADENSIESNERAIINNVFKMNDLTAKEIMTPRVQIDALSSLKTIKEMEQEIFELEHSRLPIFGKDYDDIKGFVLLRDILECLAKDQKKLTLMDPSLHNDIIAVRENVKIDTLIKLFQTKRTHIALVVDEFGGTSGLVTLEDVLEQLVGEIIDETDSIVDLRSIKNEDQTTLQESVIEEEVEESLADLKRENLLKPI
jgi:CBS domain containing-hemolysin-like protein